MLSDSYVYEADLADELDCSPRTLKRWRARRIGPPFIKMGKRIVYRREAVDAWLLSLEQGQPRAGKEAAA